MRIQYRRFSQPRLWTPIKRNRAFRERKTLRKLFVSS
jgi:hypothetical protein